MATIAKFNCITYLYAIENEFNMVMGYMVTQKLTSSKFHINISNKAGIKRRMKGSILKVFLEISSAHCSIIRINYICY